jgi:undecaprenyl-diphosphatase
VCGQVSAPSSAPATARTVALAVAGLAAITGLFVLLATLGRTIDVTGFDHSVARGVHSLLSDDAAGAMRVLTYVGALQVALPLCVLVAVVLARVHDRRAMVALIVVYAATQAIVTLIKVLVERDRPAGSEALIGGYAFPSGHSATAVAVYGALALIAVRHLGPRVRTAAIAAAALLAITVGITRVYLGVHYPTDVLGGWLLGGAVLAVVWRLAVVRPAT